MAGKTSCRRSRAGMRTWRPPATTSLGGGATGVLSVHRRGTLAAPSHRGPHSPCTPGLPDRLSRLRVHPRGAVALCRLHAAAGPQRDLFHIRASQIAGIAECAAKRRILVKKPTLALTENLRAKIITEESFRVPTPLTARCNGHQSPCCTSAGPARETWSDSSSPLGVWPWISVPQKRLYSSRNRPADAHLSPAAAASPRRASRIPGPAPERSRRRFCRAAPRLKPSQHLVSGPELAVSESETPDR